MGHGGILVTTINGVAVSLTAGMTQAQVLQTINGQSSATGVIASATGANGTGAGNYLTFRSSGYGAAAAVKASSGSESSVATSTQLPR